MTNKRLDQVIELHRFQVTQPLERENDDVWIETILAEEMAKERSDPYQERRDEEAARYRKEGYPDGAKTPTWAKCIDIDGNELEVGQLVRTRKGNLVEFSGAKSDGTIRIGRGGHLRAIASHFGLRVVTGAT